MSGYAAICRAESCGSKTLVTTLSEMLSVCLAAAAAVAGFEPTCNLGNLTTVPGSSPAVPYVPRGNFSLCTAQGTNTGRVLPGGLVVPPNTPLAPGSCWATPDCNSTDLLCSNTVTTRRCVCDEATGMDACEQFCRCGLTPCAVCRRCFLSMQQVADAQQSVTNATAVAEAFKTACMAGGRTLETCRCVRVLIRLLHVQHLL